MMKDCGDGHTDLSGDVTTEKKVRQARASEQSGRPFSSVESRLETVDASPTRRTRSSGADWLLWRRRQWFSADPNVNSGNKCAPLTPVAGATFPDRRRRIAPCNLHGRRRGRETSTRRAPISLVIGLVTRPTETPSNQRVRPSAKPPALSIAGWNRIVSGSARPTVLGGAGAAPADDGEVCSADNNQPNNNNERHGRRRLFARQTLAPRAQGSRNS